MDINQNLKSKVTQSKVESKAAVTSVYTPSPTCKPSVPPIPRPRTPTKTSPSPTQTQGPSTTTQQFFPARSRSPAPRSPTRQSPGMKAVLTAPAITSNPSNLYADPRHMHRSISAPVCAGNNKTTIPELCAICKKHKVNYICETCDKRICDNCNVVHQNFEELKTHVVVDLPHDEDDISLDDFTCANHADRKLTTCCITCTDVICGVCVYGEHRGHEFYSLIDDSHTLFHLQRFCEKKLESTTFPFREFQTIESRIHERKLVTGRKCQKHSDIVRQREQELVSIIERETSSAVSDCKNTSSQTIQNLDNTLLSLKDVVNASDIVRQLQNAERLNKPASVVKLLVSASQIQQHYDEKYIDIARNAWMDENECTPNIDDTEKQEFLESVKSKIKQYLSCTELHRDYSEYQPDAVQLDCKGSQNIKPLLGKGRTIFAQDLMDDKLIFIKSLEGELVQMDLQGKVKQTRKIKPICNAEVFVVSDSCCGYIDGHDVHFYDKDLNLIHEMPNMDQEFIIRTIAKFSDIEFVSFQTRQLDRKHRIVWEDFTKIPRIKRMSMCDLKTDFPIDGRIILSCAPETKLLCTFFNSDTLYIFDKDGVLLRTHKFGYGPKFPPIRSVCTNNEGDLFVNAKGVRLVPRIGYPSRGIMMKMGNDFLEKSPEIVFVKGNEMFYLGDVPMYGCPDEFLIEKYTFYTVS